MAAVDVAASDVFRDRALDDLADLAAQGRQLGRRGRIAVEMALGLAHHPRLRRDVELGVGRRSDDQLRRAAADVHHHDRAPVGRALARRTGEGQLRFLVSVDGPGVEAVALPDLVGELRPVGGVADRAGEDGHLRVGRCGRDVRGVVVEHLEDPLHRRVLEPSVAVHSRAQARDLAATFELGDTTVRHVRDEQTRGVGPDVDDCDPHGAACYGPGGSAGVYRGCELASNDVPGYT
jgi:hypothetical protein